MTSRWLVWAKDRPDFFRWSGDRNAPIFVLWENRAHVVKDPSISDFDEARLLVINGAQASSFPQTKVKGLDKWLDGAKAWIHIGGVNASPSENHWRAFDAAALRCSWPSLARLAPAQRKAFGSTYNRVVYQEIAPLAVAVLAGGSTATVLDKLERAWTADDGATQAEGLLARLQQMFPVYLLLTHPDALQAQDALRAAVQFALDAKDDARKTLLLESEMPLLRALAPAPPSWPVTGAVEAFLAHFYNAAKAVGLQLEAAQILRLPGHKEP